MYTHDLRSSQLFKNKGISDVTFNNKSIFYIDWEERKFGGRKLNFITFTQLNTTAVDYVMSICGTRKATSRAYY